MSPDVGLLPMDSLTLSGCKDQLGNPVTVVSGTGWQVSWVSDSGNTACPSGTGTDETSGSDCLVILMPKGGLVFRTSTCTITLAPNGAAAMGAPLSDPGGTTPDTFSINSPAPYSSDFCGTGTAQISGQFTMTTPNGGVLVDGS